MKKICIHQPDFSPYVGFFERLLHVDEYVIFDDVQFIKRGWQHRDKIKTNKGAEWLSLSVASGDFHRKINETLLSDNNVWRNDCINKISQHYKKAKCYDECFPKLIELFKNAENRLDLYNINFIRFFNDIFEINVATIRSSALKVEGKSNELLINICKQLNATHYLTGTGSKDYLDESMFLEHGIVVEWQDFNHPVYPQLYGEFIPYLSVIDLVLNCGIESRDIIRKKI